MENLDFAVVFNKLKIINSLYKKKDIHKQVDDENIIVMNYIIINNKLAGQGNT